MSHTQRRDNSLRGSLQGLTLSVAGVGAGTHDEHNEIDECPDAGHDQADDGQRYHQLNDALRGVAQVEVVNTEGAQEERQEQGNDPLLRGTNDGLAVGGLPVSRLTVSRLTVGLLARSIGGLLIAGLTVGIRTVGALRVRVGAGNAVALLRLGVGAGRGSVVRSAVGRRTGGRRGLVVDGGRGLGESRSLRGGDLSGFLRLEGSGLRIGRRPEKAFR